MDVIIDASSLEMQGQRYIHASDYLTAGLQALLPTLAVGVEALGVAAVQAVTPSKQNPTISRQGVQYDYYTDALRDSTKAYSTMDGMILTTDITQDYANNGWMIAPIVIGGRGAIKGNPYLRTPWGPRASVAASRPNDYPLKAYLPLATATAALAQRWGEQAANFILKDA